MCICKLEHRNMMIDRSYIMFGNILIGGARGAIPLDQEIRIKQIPRFIRGYPKLV